MNKGTRKNVNYLDAADLPVRNINQPLNDGNTDNLRPNVKLRSLVDQEKYEEARALFIEIVKSNKYHFKNLWQIGIEIIGKSSPKDLIGYLKAVYISSPPSFSAEIFKVYIDEMMIEEQWEDALEEMQLRYDDMLYHHPIMLRNMALCAYNIWKKFRDDLPESYFDDDNDQRDQYDINVVRYEKHTRLASKYLEEAHKTYLRDAELLNLYFDFLILTNDKKKTKKMILESLEVCKQDPEYYLLFNLLKINKIAKVFDNQDYILQLYTLDPFLSSNAMGLDVYCKQQSIEIAKTISDTQSTPEQLENAYELGLEIFKLYIFRFEHGNPEEWFQQVITVLFNSAISDTMVNLYHERKVDTLLKSPFIKNKIQGDWYHLIDIMQDIILKYDDVNSTLITKEEEEDDDDEDDDEGKEEGGEEEEEKEGDDNEKEVDEEEEDEDEEEDDEDEEMYERESFM